MPELPTNPGSYNEFVNEHHLEAGIGALAQYSDALASYRSELAEAHGITREDLHARAFGNLVQIDLVETA